MQKKLIRIVLVTASLLLIPLIAMQFSDEMDWDITDFIVMGALISGTGLIYEVAASKIRKPSHRIIIGIVLFVAFLLMWGELAVGLFGTPFAGN